MRTKPNSISKFISNSSYLLFSSSAPCVSDRDKSSVWNFCSHCADVIIVVGDDDDDDEINAFSFFTGFWK